MTAATRPGSFQFPSVTGTLPPSSQEAMDAAVQALAEHKDAWVDLSIRDRVAILDQLIKDFAAGAERWVAASLEAKGIAPGSAAVGDEWVAGPYAVMISLRQFRQSLLDIERYGRPSIPGPVTTRPDGQVVAQVFPQRGYDKLFYSSVTAEVWMEPGVTAESLPSTQAVIYHGKKQPGKVALVLGAGNVASIGPLDVLYKLFVEDQVVLYKANPVNAYLGPLFEETFRVLVDRGFLRIIYGGAQEGAYLCNHSGIEEIHITGSDKTFEAIVFGTGPEGAARKAKKQPLLNKRITGELGNVSPVIVVPGPWSESDLAYHGEHIATMLTNNAGFNCNATRVIIQHAGWGQREALMKQVRAVLGQVPPRKAYYPGAQQRYEAFRASHPDAEEFGTASDGQLPWVLVSNLDPDHDDDICFTTEAFCGLFGETALEAASVAEYIDHAVEFANDHLWGTLNATILVHPASLKDPAVAAALERAVANLRFGSVAINFWAATAYILGVTTWGGFPGAPLEDIQSGTGVVHNTLMFDRPQKSVVRAPFRAQPTPPWFVTKGQAGAKLFSKLVQFEAAPSPMKVPGILVTALRG
jgi:acyl-CoA reductase-like NAD-dependent aldehyde dehydrogenase